jgi:hypothetical protein
MLIFTPDTSKEFPKAKKTKTDVPLMSFYTPNPMKLP